MNGFFETWGEAAMTTLGFFWTALWAFCLGYIVSALIQVFVTRERMRRTMGRTGARSIAIGTGFGFVSSSCSFAALSTTRALFQKGSGLAPALAFLLASTNLVIELGILIFLFLSWHFVVGEYIGGILLILITWLLVKLTLPKGLVERARAKAEEVAGEEASGDPPDPKALARSREGWRRMGRRVDIRSGRRLPMSVRTTIIIRIWLPWVVPHLDVRTSSVAGRQGCLAAGVSNGWCQADKSLSGLHVTGDLVAYTRSRQSSRSSPSHVPENSRTDWRFE